ncbi:MAG: VanZ family protein [Deltaproteobacteria bacterium]|nr:VanZ family protein [Deltaproteobacteria bacterium]
MGIIFYLSHQPGDLLQLPSFPAIDKLAHFIAYGTLAGTFLYALNPFATDKNGAVVAIMAVLFCIIFGISDEYHQSFIPGRSVSSLDVLADALGALFVTVSWFLKNKHKVSG